MLVGIPDLEARIDDLAAEDDRVYARLTVTGTNTGNFFGVPPTGRRYEVGMFDYARLEDGRIVKRVQQSDLLSQLRQMYAGAAKKAAIAGGLGAAAFLVLRKLARAGWGTSYSDAASSSISSECVSGETSG